MSIVTKTGDDGLTGLYGAKRVSKASSRMHAIGTVDELNAVMGMVIAQGTLPESIANECDRIQQLLFRAGSDLATPLSSEAQVPRMEESHVKEIESWIERMEPRLPPLTAFILPSGSQTGSAIHLARAVARRAERWIVDLSQAEDLNPQLRIYLNRLSDYLFLLARAANRAEGSEEREVKYT